MWRLLATTPLFAGCNALFGIHEIVDVVPDASSDPCITVCECKLDDDCGAPHTVCVDQVTSRTCECAAGYAPRASGCTWSGVVDDPGFDQTSDPWIISGMATRDATAAQTNGMQDPGQLVLTTDTSCNNVGQAVQTLVMPRRSRAEALVVRATYNSLRPSPPRPLIGLRSVWYGDNFAIGNGFDFVTARACLGAAHYAPELTTGLGGEVSLTAWFTPAPGRCAQAQQFNLDHVDIVPADAVDNCPEPGPVVNGDLEGTGGWRFTTSGTGVAMIAAGVGFNGSHGIQLQTMLGCDIATAAIPIWVPLADANGSPALSLYHAGAPPELSLVLDSVRLPLSSGQATDRYCIPAPLRGGVFPLRASLFSPSAGNCTDAVPAMVVLDNLSVANDPLCGNDPGIADAGFESGTALLTTSATVGQSTAMVMTDSNAHGGQRDLALTVSYSCTNAIYSVSVATPAAHLGEGPAAAFWYRISSGTSALVVSGVGSAFAPTRDAQWHQGLACLAPLAPGRAQTLSVMLSTSSSSCGTMTPETAFVDDLSVLSTPMCAAK